MSNGPPWILEFPNAALGRTAARLRLEEADKSADHEHKHVRFAPEPIVRQSTIRACDGQRAG